MERGRSGDKVIRSNGGRALSVSGEDGDARQEKTLATAISNPLSADVVR